ncbi:MAG: hypothetical protein AB9M60_17435, partial [Leptothrix sp. (in: b-proteobacteria)]
MSVRFWPRHGRASWHVAWALLASVATAPLQAAPFAPQRDDEVVETLKQRIHVGNADQAAEAARLRAARA